MNRPLFVLCSHSPRSGLLRFEEPASPSFITRADKKAKEDQQDENVQQGFRIDLFITVNMIRIVQIIKEDI